MTDEHVQKILLNCRLGEFTLGTFKLPLVVHAPNLTADMAARDIFTSFDFPKEAAGALFRSQPVSGILPRLSWVGRYIQYVPTQFPRYYIDLEMGLDAYQNKFSSKSRSTLKRKLRKFAEISGGEIHWSEHKSPDEMEEFYRLAREVSEKTYQEKLLDAGLPIGEQFHFEMKALARQGRVRAYLLFHDNKPVAYLYCPINNGALLYAYLGYLPEYAKWSPGTVLQWLALERLFAEGDCRIFDFTGGDGEHKKYFATGKWDCADIYLLKKNPYNYIVVVTHACINLISERIGLLLEKSGIKAGLKKWLRRQAIVEQR